MRRDARPACEVRVIAFSDRARHRVCILRAWQDVDWLSDALLASLWTLLDLEDLATGEDSTQVTLVVRTPTGDIPL